MQYNSISGIKFFGLDFSPICSYLHFSGFLVHVLWLCFFVFILQSLVFICGVQLLGIGLNGYKLKIGDLTSCGGSSIVSYSRSAAVKVLSRRAETHIVTHWSLAALGCDIVR